MVNTIKIQETDYPITLGVKDVQAILGVGERIARNEIKELNKELTAKGKRVVKGRVFTEYFFERYSLM